MDTKDEPTAMKAARESSLGTRNIKGLAHPLRIRILGALRIGGPSTASSLASRLGESSGATSYHLRQLEKFGFVIEELDRGSRRERWWRAAQQSTQFDEAALVRDPETRAFGSEFLRLVAGATLERALSWIDSLPSFPGQWAEAGTMSDWGLRLDPAQLRELKAEMEALVGRYPRFDPEEEGKPGTAYVSVQLQLLPRLEA